MRYRSKANQNKDKVTRMGEGKQNIIKNENAKNQLGNKKKIIPEGKHKNEIQM